jgi:hypothetical protein
MPATLSKLTATIPRGVFWWIMVVSFSWKVAVALRPHSHRRTNHAAISSQEVSRPHHDGTSRVMQGAREILRNEKRLELSAKGAWFGAY